MSAAGKLTIGRISPNSSIQDFGRPYALEYGISSSGPMDRRSLKAALALAGGNASSAIEFGMLGIDFEYHGNPVQLGFAGGRFSCSKNGAPIDYPGSVELNDGDEISIKTGPQGVYGYLAFADEFDVPKVMDSRSTNVTASIGGLNGQSLQNGDKLNLISIGETDDGMSFSNPTAIDDAPIRVLPGLHADMLGPSFWQSLFEAPFKISTQLDRMGVRLVDANKRFDISDFKNIVSDSVVPGDIQILGDGTPVVLMRDHQPVGGYPRIATVIDADQDRFAQLRPNTEVNFEAVSLATAQGIAKKAKR